MDGKDRFSKLLTDSYDHALKLGLPLFPYGIDASTPMNGAPYVAGWEQLESTFAFTPARRALLDGLRAAAMALSGCGCTPYFAMIGGSYADIANHAPKDLDCMIGYVVKQKSVSGIKLRDIQNDANKHNIDMRLMPLDGHPAYVAKLVAFFAMLYSQRRSGREQGSIIIIPLDRLADDELVLTKL